MLRFVVIFSSLVAAIHCLECKESGNGYFRDPEDCAKMIRCSDGKITHRFSCSEGKVFNDITKSCDDPKYVNCHNSVTATTPVTTSPDSLTTPAYEGPKAPIAARLQSLTVGLLSSTTETPKQTTLTTSPTSTSPQTIATEDTTLGSHSDKPRLESKTESIDRLIDSENGTQSADKLRTIAKSAKTLSINESFVEYEEIQRKTLPFNESFVVYERLSLPFNQSFVEYIDDIKITTTTEVTATESSTEDSIQSYTHSSTQSSTDSSTDFSTESSPQSLTDSYTESSTELSTESPTEETTVATTIPTSIQSDVSPVLESVLQNETTIETTTTESPQSEITNKRNSFCAVDESSVGFRMISSNYSTSETSKLTDYFKVVCYFTNWSRYRPESAKFKINNINPYLCSHIIYAFAVLDNQTLTMKSSDECTDIDNKFYEQITSLKERNPRLKVLIALGGWVDSEGDKYSRLVSNETNRKNFIADAIQFLNRHNFDGLDLDWEYPKCWQANCTAGPASDKLNFAKLIRELRNAFNEQRRPLLLTAAVGATQYIGDNAYEFNALMINLDFINLMTYDFYTAGSAVAAHHSPLYSHPNAKDIYHSVSNANFSVNYWLRKGVPSHKLIMGIPFYGRTFKLMDSNDPQYGAPVNGTGNQGIYTKESGFLAYYEICANILRKGWAKRVDTYVRNGRPLMTGPYAYNIDQWVGYDDRDHVIQKTEFIKDNGLGGAMVWALDLDDFNGVCCKTKSPLLKTINKELRDYRFDLKFFCP